ncbi:hypothetical protein OIO90_003539 [Microbotryomycetes sp. JL221]|nr:hypothetical protein OIO90_003539 [Microbotryomycetes sp. JL221]
MRMLEHDDADADAPVTLQDQQHINQFSRLNSRFDELVEEIQDVKRQLEDVEEVETELELMEQDEIVLYKLDSSFLHLPAQEAIERLHTTLEQLKTQSEQLEQEKESSQNQMKQLKAILYAKFGKSINLERD